MQDICKDSIRLSKLFLDHTNFIVFIYFFIQITFSTYILTFVRKDVHFSAS